MADKSTPQDKKIKFLNGVSVGNVNVTVFEAKGKNGYTYPLFTVERTYKKEGDDKHQYTKYLNSRDLFDAAAALKVVANEYGVRRYRKQGDEEASEK